MKEAKKMETVKLNSALDEFASKVVERARKNLNTSGFGGQKSNRKKNSSGKLSKSLGYRIRKQAGFNYIVDFVSSVNYAAIVEEGRNKGTMPPIGKIKQWINEKPIRIQKTIKTQGIATKRFVKKTEANINSAAFAIAKSIAKKGIKPTPYFWEALEYEIDNATPELEEALARDLEDFITDNFSKKSNIKVL